MKNVNPEFLRSFSTFGRRSILSAAMVLLLWTVSSCHKEPPHPKPGPAIVVDAFTGKPLPFVKLVAATNNTGTAWGSQPAASTLSDSTGHFWFPDFMPAGGDIWYELHATKMHYVSGNIASFTASTYNGDLRVEMIPYGYIRMHVPKTHEKLSSFRITGGFKPGITFTAPYKDTSYIVSEVGNAMTSIWIRLYYPNGETKEIRDEIFMPALDTVDYHVKF